MRKIGLSIVFFVIAFNLNSQNFNASDKFNLSTTVKETSGLIYFNGRLVTHNDSGNTPQLFEIDTLNGSISRTVTISNATNIDWEDIAQDSQYLYIGDIGNNSGSRTNLKIYRVSKSDFEANTSITADVINYSYADQVDFTANTNNNNWDAEGLITWGDKLLVFSKNWVNNQVDVYVIPKTIGTYSAAKSGTYNVQGLITGADKSSSDNIIYLIGYTETTLTPFVLLLHNINLPSENFDVFSNSSITKLDNVLGAGRQTESVSFIGNTSSGLHKHLLISNEEFTFSGFTVPSKLTSLNISTSVLDVLNPELENFNIFPNPFNNKISFSELVDKVDVYDGLGRQVLSERQVKNIYTNTLKTGMYFIYLTIDEARITEKIIKY